uniref:Putative glycosyltransferase n=1 Tax=viral metagenome TaxID=1070528 RepID=A0A6M3KUM8_9ZZZZ
MKVGIALSCYNHEKYLERAIESILRQTYTDWHLAVFLNASTDNSYGIAYEYKIKNPDRKIKIHNKFNREVFPIGIARYLMMEYFIYDFMPFPDNEYKVDLITILDADDFWREDKLEKQVALYKSNTDNKLIFSDCYYYYQDIKVEQVDNYPAFIETKMNKVDLKNTFHSKYPPLMDNPFNNLLLRYNFMPCPTLMFERKALKEVIGIPMPYTSAEDYDWVVKMAKWNDCAYVPEPLAFYRIHKEQLTQRAPARCTVEEIDVFKRFIKYLPRWKALLHLFYLYCKLIYKEIREVVI